MKRSNKPRWLSAWEAGDAGAALEAFSPGLILHFSDNLVPRLPSGRDGLSHLIRLLRTAFPDLKWSVAQCSGQGQTAVLTCIGRGTHRGPLFHIAPTARRVSFPARFMVRSDGEQIVEMWIRTALAGLLPQLGMGPEAA